MLTLPIQPPLPIQLPPGTPTVFIKIAYSLLCGRTETHTWFEATWQWRLFITVGVVGVSGWSLCGGVAWWMGGVRWGVW